MLLLLCGVKSSLTQLNLKAIAVWSPTKPSMAGLVDQLRAAFEMPIVSVVLCYALTMEHAAACTRHSSFPEPLMARPLPPKNVTLRTRHASVDRTLKGSARQSSTPSSSSSHQL